MQHKNIPFRGLKIVLTGGPGVGKTSIIEELKKRGFTVKLEIFTELFERAEKTVGLDKLFEDLPKLLHELIILQQSLESDVGNGEVIFYDRGMIDILGFAHNLNLTFSPEDKKIVESARYDGVFIIEPLPSECYVQNNIRRQSFTESLEHHAQVSQCYLNYYNQIGKNAQKHLIFVPNYHAEKEFPTKSPLQEAVAKRVDFILQKLSLLDDK